MKINFKYAILSAALAVGMVSCNDDPNVDGPNEPKEGVPTYMDFSFTFNDEKTRAYGGDEETNMPNESEVPGTAEESKINTISVYVFTKQAAGDVVDPSTTGIYYTLVVGTDPDKDDAWKVGNSPKDEPVYRTKKLAVTTGYKEVYVGVNLPPTLAGEIANHGINGIKRKAHLITTEKLIELNGKANFSMFSDTEETVNIVDATYDEVGPDPGQKNHVRVKVERMVAKVQVRENLSRASSDMTATGWYNVKQNKETTSDIVGKLNAALQYDMGQVNTTLYAMQNYKNLGGGLFANADPNWYKDEWVWDTPGHESNLYYEPESTRKTDPTKYTYDEDDFEDFFTQPAYGGWKEVFFLGDYDKTEHEQKKWWKYIMENTSEYAMRGTNTYAAIKTTFIPRLWVKKGDATFTSVPNDNFTNETLADFYMVQRGTAKDKLGVREFVYFEDLADAKAYALASKDDVVGGPEGKQDDYILAYNNGECYYRVYIGKQNTYNVGRNIYYKATLTAFYGRPGNPDPTPPDPEKPWPIDPEDTYLQVTIEVLPWTVYYDDYTPQY